MRACRWTQNESGIRLQGRLSKSAPSRERGGFPSMRFKTAFAQTAQGNPVQDAHAAVRKIRADFEGFTPAFVIFFASVDYDPDAVAAGMKEMFPEATTMGCSSAWEACDGRMLDGNLVAMGFSAEVFAFAESALVLADADAAGEAGAPNVFQNATDAMRHLTRHLGKQPIDLDFREYVGFMLGDATSPFTEGVIERIGEMTNMFLIGGIASDRYTFDRHVILYNGKAYRNGAAALALWRPRQGFELLKTQAVELTDTQFIVTDVDEEKRIIWKLDGRDAAAAYSEAIGIQVEKIGNPEFDMFPLAMVAEGDPYLRVAIAVVEGRGLQMYSRIRGGMCLTLTKARGFVEMTEKALADKIAETGEPAAILHLNCTCRYTAMARTGETEAFGRLFSRWPHIGYASFGEVYANLVGLTSVMILFK